MVVRKKSNGQILKITGLGPNQGDSNEHYESINVPLIGFCDIYSIYVWNE